MTAVTAVTAVTARDRLSTTGVWYFTDAMTADEAADALEARSPLA